MTPYELTRSDGGKSVMWIAPDANPADEIAKWQQSANGITIASSREMTAADVAAHRQKRAAAQAAALAAPTITQRLAALERTR